MRVGEQRTCQDCGQHFAFSKGEREFFAARNFEPPKRCPTCRQIRRSLRDVTDGPRRAGERPDVRA